jgi:hypothetical protein
MADSNAVRLRRSRAHRRDDHSLCVPGRCSELDAPDRPPTARLEAASLARLDAHPVGADQADLVEQWLAMARRVDERNDAQASAQWSRIRDRLWPPVPRTPAVRGEAVEDQAAEDDLQRRRRERRGKARTRAAQAAAAAHWAKPRSPEAAAEAAKWEHLGERQRAGS